MLLSLRHMPDAAHGKQSSACILLIVKTCMSLHAKHLYRNSVMGAQTTRLECPSPEWLTMDPTFCRGASSGVGTWRSGDGFPAGGISYRSNLNGPRSWCRIWSTRQLQTSFTDSHRLEGPEDFCAGELHVLAATARLWANTYHGTRACAINGADSLLRRVSS